MKAKMMVAALMAVVAIPAFAHPHPIKPPIHVKHHHGKPLPPPKHHHKQR